MRTKEHDSVLRRGWHTYIVRCSCIECHCLPDCVPWISFSTESSTVPWMSWIFIATQELAFHLKEWKLDKCPRFLSLFFASFILLRHLLLHLLHHHLPSTHFSSYRASLRSFPHIFFYSIPCIWGNLLVVTQNHLSNTKSMSSTLFVKSFCLRNLLSIVLFLSPKKKRLPDVSYSLPLLFFLSFLLLTKFRTTLLPLSSLFLRPKTKLTSFVFSFVSSCPSHTEKRKKPEGRRKRRS